MQMTRWGWEIPLHIARRLQANEKASIHEDGFASSGRPSCVCDIRRKARPAWRATRFHVHYVPKQLYLPCQSEKKREELQCIPHGWHSIHCTAITLLLFLTFFILWSIELASVKLAERYSRKRYLSTHTVGRKWKSPSWTRTSLFVCLLRHGRKVDQMLGVYLSVNALFGTGN